MAGNSTVLSELVIAFAAILLRPHWVELRRERLSLDDESDAMRLIGCVSETRGDRVSVVTDCVIGTSTLVILSG